MPPAELTDEQVKALILNFLLRRKRWGARYYNRQRMVRSLGLDVLGDGKVVSRCMDELVKSRWVNLRKKGDTISLNISYIREITGHIDRHLI